MLSEEQGFSLLKRRIFHDRGLDCEQYKENYLKRRIAVRLRATGARDYLEYLRILRTDPAEYTILMNELTINVTQFFRDKDVYLKLRDEVLPGLVRAKAAMGSRSLRIWSAGCASGEEPYSLAILVEETLGEDSGKWNVRVLGSDFDDKSLEHAREGTYEDLEMLEPIDAGKYFEISESQGTKLFRVKDEIKRRVRFEKINLLAESEARHFDLVCCRNVLIYFGRQVQNKIIENLSNSILRDGYIVLGKSETLGPDLSTIFKPAFARERIYQLAVDPKPVRVNRAQGAEERATGEGRRSHREKQHDRRGDEPGSRGEMRGSQEERTKADLRALRERRASRAARVPGGPGPERHGAKTDRDGARPEATGAGRGTRDGGTAAPTGANRGRGAGTEKGKGHLGENR